MENPLKPSELILGDGPRGQDFYKMPDGETLHLSNWLECIRSRKRPNVPAGEGAKAAAAAHLWETSRTVRTRSELACLTKMRTLILYFLTAVLGWAEPGFKALFNGKDLSGWQQDTPGLWSVRDGMIIGKTSALRHNDFLRTRDNFRDFTLKLSFRLVNGIGNSGIQFRSRPVPGSHEVSGYQADIGETYWGCLYDESRRKKVLANASPAALAKVNKEGWNEYVITARGNRITLDLNGIRSLEFDEKEPGMDLPGIIALQVHSGPGLEVQFKDIRIQEH